jgi:hypothetical protein
LCFLQKFDTGQHFTYKLVIVINSFRGIMGAPEG